MTTIIITGTLGFFMVIQSPAIPAEIQSPRSSYKAKPPPTSAATDEDRPLPAQMLQDNAGTVIKPCTCEMVCTSLVEALKAPEDVCRLSLTEKRDALPPDIGHFRNLEYLSLQDNDLASLPSEIATLTKLKTLHLWSNRLTHLPPEIGNLFNLETLVLNSNNIEEFPSVIGELTNLIRLHIASNKLQTVSSEIGKLTNLETLGLSYNQITAVAPEIGNLRKLKNLNLENNNLARLPQEIRKLFQLKVLAAYGNDFSPEERAKIKQLLPHTQIFFDASVLSL